MKVSSIMTRGVVTVDMDDSLQTIREILNSFEFHHVPVVDGQKLIGIISDRDLLSELSPFLDTPSQEHRDFALLKKRAHQIMSRILITVNAGTSIEIASNLLLENNISCLPVVSSKDNVKGIVTWKDILRFYMKQGQ